MKATIGFAGRVITRYGEEKHEMPSLFQTAEYVKDHGGIDLWLKENI